MRFLILASILGLLLALYSVMNDWRIESKHAPIGDFVEVDGQKIHYLDFGQQQSKGPVLVLVHGAFGNLLDMKLALGDTLARSHRVIIIDRPGRGYSQRPDDGYLLKVQTKLIHGALEKMGIENPLMIGQSFGGVFSLRYALDYPEDLSGMVLLAPVTHEWPGDVAWFNKASNIPVVGFLLRRLMVPLYGQLVAPSGVDGTFWPQAAPEDYLNKTGLGLVFRPKDFKNNAADMKNLKSQIIQMSKGYDTINLPVKIFVGSHDTTVSPTIHSYILAGEIEGADLTILPRHGHGLHHSAKTEIVNGIEDMVDNILSARNTQETQ